MAVTAVGGARLARVDRRWRVAHVAPVHRGAGVADGSVAQFNAPHAARTAPLPDRPCKH